ncbi:MAG: hypothetical protein MJ193_02875, partial [Clostridia bacterium]|nr:hypothetical protein [Clostridia bacterium]
MPNIFYVPDSIHGLVVAEADLSETSFSDLENKNDINMVRISAKCQKINGIGFSDLQNVRTVICETSNVPTIMPNSNVFYVGGDTFCNEGLYQIIFHDEYISAIRQTATTSPLPFLRQYFDYIISDKEYRIETPSSSFGHLLFFDAETSLRVAGAVPGGHKIMISTIPSESYRLNSISAKIFDGDNIKSDSAYTTINVVNNNQLSLESSTFQNAPLKRVRVTAEFSQDCPLHVKVDGNRLDSETSSKYAIISYNPKFDDDDASKLTDAVIDVKPAMGCEITVNSIKLSNSTDGDGALSEVTPEVTDTSYKITNTIGESCKSIVLDITISFSKYNRTINWNLEPWIGTEGSGQFEVKTTAEDALQFSQHAPTITNDVGLTSNSYYQTAADIQDMLVGADLQSAEFKTALSDRKLKRKHSTLDGITYGESGSAEFVAVYDSNLEGRDAWPFPEVKYELKANWNDNINKVAIEPCGASDAGASAAEKTFVNNAKRLQLNPFDGKQFEEKYASEIVHTSIDRVVLPGFDLIGYANKPQQNYNEMVTGKFYRQEIETTQNATTGAGVPLILYYVPDPDDSSKMKANDRQKRDWQPKDEIARGTYWDFDTEDSVVTLYAIWKKAEWEGKIDTPYKYSDT